MSRVFIALIVVVVVCVGSGGGGGRQTGRGYFCTNKNKNNQMTHNEKRTHWVKEGAIGLSTGILFGLTNVVVGHVS